MRNVLFICLLALVSACTRSDASEPEPKWQYATIHVKSDFLDSSQGRNVRQVSTIELHPGVTVKAIFNSGNSRALEGDTTPGFFEFLLENPENKPVEVYTHTTLRSPKTRLGARPVRILLDSLDNFLTDGDASGLQAAYFTVVGTPVSSFTMTCRVIASSVTSSGGMITSCRQPYEYRARNEF